ncbi:hypothetical protein RUND412_003031 [Rhizina undulata]
MSGLSALSEVSYISYQNTKNEGLLSLANELLFLILRNLDGNSIARCAQTCKQLRALSQDDLLWSRLVSHLHVSDPAPYSNFKDLYIFVRNHMWLHGKLWYGDRHPNGTLLVSRYSPSTGGISLFRVKALKRDQNDEPMPRQNFHHASLTIHDFDADVGFGNAPVITLCASSRIDDTGETFGALGKKFYSLSRAAVPVNYRENSNERLWPPARIPAKHRIPDSWSGAHGRTISSAVNPSQEFMLLKKWRIKNESNGFSGHYLNVDRLITFAALDEEFLTPDVEHPFRGMWVYGSEEDGYQFLHFHQIGDRLEAFRLTGDRNVPRGEYSFVIPSLKKVIRTTDELGSTSGVQVVSAKSQVADRGMAFRRMREGDAEVYLISENEVAIRGDWAWSDSPESAPPNAVFKIKRVPLEELLRSGKMRLGDGVKTSCADLVLLSGSSGESSSGSEYAESDKGVESESE